MNGQQYEILDETGHKTGKTADKDIVHQQQLWHEVSNVWIINGKSEVLLQLRSPQVELNPGVWDVAVGTHVLPGEDPTVAAQRALQTELGLTITPDQLKHLFNIQSENPAGDNKLHRVLGHVFLLKRDVDLAECTIDQEKISELDWRPLVQVMAEIGSTETAATYFPRAGNYYPQLFDALQAEMPL